MIIPFGGVGIPRQTSWVFILPPSPARYTYGYYMRDVEICTTRDTDKGLNKCLLYPGDSFNTQLILARGD